MRSLFIIAICALSLSVVSALSLVAPSANRSNGIPSSSRIPGAVVVYDRPSNYVDPRTLYARIIRLQSGKLLTTCEVYPPEKPFFPIFESDDSGATWTHISNVVDVKNGYGNRYQPFLFQLDRAFASWPAGTLFLAGNSVPDDHITTELNLYVSANEGKSWKFVSTIAKGGRAFPNNGETPVWEPFLVLYNDALICFYSDQRDPKHGQKLVHQVSEDGVTWGRVIEDFSSPTYRHRPGMPIVSKLASGQYVMTFEFYGAPEYDFAAYYMIAPTPYDFKSASAQVVRAEGHAVPAGSPYNVWTPQGGSAGTIVVSASNSAALYTLDASGNGRWQYVPTSAPSGYSRSLLVTDDGVMVASGGALKGKGKQNKLLVQDVPL